MIELERRLAERYPKWFEGPQGRLARPLVRGLGKWSGLDEAERFLADNAHLRGRAQRQGVDLDSALRAPPPEPGTCCGRGCHGCVWEGYYHAVRYWADDALDVLTQTDRPAPTTPAG